MEPSKSIILKNIIKHIDYPDNSGEEDINRLAILFFFLVLCIN